MVRGTTRAVIRKGGCPGKVIPTDEHPPGLLERSEQAQGYRVMGKGVGIDASCTIPTQQRPQGGDAASRGKYHPQPCAQWTGDHVFIPQRG